MSRRHPYFGEPVDPELVSTVATYGWAAVRLPESSVPSFLRNLKRGVHLYTLASGSQIQPVQVEIEEQVFEVPMGMTRYRDDPFDEARINVDEYQIFKLVTRHGDLHTVSYRAVSQPPRRNHHLPALPDSIWQTPEITMAGQCAQKCAHSTRNQAETHGTS